MKKHKWIVEGLVVVLIIGLGFVIYALINGEIFDGSGSEETQTTEKVSPSPEQDQVQSQDQSLQSQEQALQTQENSEIAAPDFELMNPDGDLISLSDFQGKIVIVNFWATWCPPCRAEMPIFQEFGEKYAEELVVLAINSGEEVEVVKSFSSQFSDAITFLVDLDTSIGERYKVRGLPTTYFVGPAGNLQAMHIGELTESLLATYLERMGID